MTAGGQRKTILEARRRSIMRMYRNGAQADEIAFALGISRKTVSDIVTREKKYGLGLNGGRAEHHGVAAGNHGQRRS